MPAGERRQESDTGRGVSPAIGVILAAAIAIILAAAVGAFVLGVGDSTDEPAPTVTADFDRDVSDGSASVKTGNEQIILTNEGGDNVPLSEMRIITEARCFDDTLLVDQGTKRGELYNLPVVNSGPNQIDNAENVNGDEIFDTNAAAISAPLSGSADTVWEAGERLSFHLEQNECDVPTDGIVTVDLIHEPSNTRIVQESLGPGFDSSFGDEIDPATAGDTSTHTWFLDLQAGDYGTAGTSGDEVDEIEVDYSSGDFDGINEDDVTVTMTRTLSGGPDRTEINVNSGTAPYNGDTATIDLSGFFQTDVAGPIKIEIDGIKNPSSAGSYTVDFTLDGDAGPKTFTKTLEIEN
jgi:FlaG/FlaF family flagellin (archaellin)